MTASHPRPLADFGGWPAVLGTLIARRDLEPEVAEAAITEILEGSATPSQMTAFIVALRAKGVLIGALAYFILPVDVIPDFILGLGFTDDVTVLAAAIATIRAHMKPRHREQAKEALERMKQGVDPVF